MSNTVFLGALVSFLLWFALRPSTNSDEDTFDNIDEQERELMDVLLNKTNTLLRQLNQKHSNDRRTHRLTKALQEPHGIRPLHSSHRQAGKTINKQLIYICLKDENGVVYDANTAMFVLIHELAHMATDTYGHTQIFWDNMRFLLKVAIDSDVYTFVDYLEHPKSYCGQKITGNPYRCVLKKQCKAT